MNLIKYSAFFLQEKITFLNDYIKFSVRDNYKFTAF